jgi:hypothetical protein
MQICPVGAELFHVDEQTDKHDKANCHFSLFFDVPKNGVKASRHTTKKGCTVSFICSY